MKKSKKIAIITSIVLVFILVVGGISGYFIYSSMSLTSNESLAAICKNRVANAQYLPNVNKIAVETEETSIATVNNFAVENEKASISTGSNPYESGNSAILDRIGKTISLNNFNQVIEDIGYIDSPYDREFTITDIKEEVYKVLSNTSIFDKWIVFNNGDLSGYGKYYISYNQEQEHITIMRSTGFQPWVYDSSSGKIVGNSDFNYKKSNYPIEEDNIYKIDYYYNEDGVEVVECEIVNFLNYYKDTIITQYQYVKNVKDTSFTKYIVTPVITLSSLEYDGSWGYDIDSNNLLGSEREFIQMDYVDKDDVSLLFVNQAFSNAYNDIEDETNIKFYRKIGNEIYLYNSFFNFGTMESWDIPNSYFIQGQSVESVFDYYIKNINVSAGATIGTPDENYALRSSDKIEAAFREMYYTNGTESLSISRGSFYIKDDDDDDLCFFKLQNISTLLTQSFTNLAKNTQMKNIKIAENLANSPKYLDISDTTYKFEYETFVSGFLDSITQNIVDSSYVKKNYKNIANAKAKSINPSNDSEISDYITLNDFESSSSVSGTTITYSASAKVEKSILLNKNSEYQLCLVAKGDGNNYIVLQVGESTKYNNNEMLLTLSNSYNLTNFNTSIADDYIVGVALVMTYKGKQIVCSNISNLTFEETENITLDSTKNDGYASSYLVNFNNGNLHLIVDVKDVQKPTIIISTSISFSENSTITNLIKKLTIEDNNKIAYIEISVESSKIFDYNDLLVSGIYNIKVYDISGNYASVDISVTIE
jgi:hypothetical protein